MKKIIFKGAPEIAITEDDLKMALEEWLESRFSYYSKNGLDLHSHEFEITEIKHCRSDSPYALRFKVSQL